MPSGPAKVLKACSDRGVLPFTTNIGGIALPAALTQAIIVILLDFLLVPASDDLYGTMFEVFVQFRRSSKLGVACLGVTVW